MRLYAAELLKLRTLRGTWGFVIVAIGLAALFTAGGIGGAGEDARLEERYQFRLVLDLAFATGILSLLLGIVLVTNEFRHGTIARTLLATPRRSTLVVLKLLAGASVGLVLAVAALAVAFVTSAIWLGVLDIPLAFGEWGDGIWRALVAAILAGVFGAAIGGAVHSQVGALVGVLVWMFVLEPICWVLLGIVPWVDLEGVAEYLPAAALGGTVDSQGEDLPWIASVAVASGWAAVAAAIALFRTGRRDVT